MKNSPAMTMETSIQELRLDRGSPIAQQTPNGRFLSLLGGYIDQLVGAADRRDWAAVGQLSEALASGSHQAGAFELCGAAQHVVAAWQSGSEPTSIRRALIRLIGVYGRTRRQGTAAETLQPVD